MATTPTPTTTPTTTTSHALTVEALERVGASLVEARQAVFQESGAPRSPQEALLALCRASYDALVAWESAGELAYPMSAEERTSWRTPLDELRVQTALAELELREAGVPVAPVHHLVGAVSEGLAAARREIGAALDSLRAELRDARR